MSIRIRVFFSSVGLICISTIATPSSAETSPPLNRRETVTQPFPQPSQQLSKTTSQLDDSRLYAIVAFIVTASSALLLPLSGVVTKRIEEGASHLETKRINEIAKLIKAESEREHATIVRVIAETSSTEDAIHEIREKLKRLELEASELNKPIKSAIESLVKSYHSQALRQSGIQFYFSVAAATVGFGLIIYAGMSAVNTDNPKRLLNAIPGAVISGVSALFFKQAEDTRKRATDLYDRLRSDERQSQAIAIANGIESQEFRSLVKAQLVVSQVVIDG
ncbi:MAG: TRADD-N-associated membrane domain-containing protein [Synechocystis sp.]